MKKLPDLFPLLLCAAAALLEDDFKDHCTDKFPAVYLWGLLKIGNSVFGVLPAQITSCCMQIYGLYYALKGKKTWRQSPSLGI